jgi:NAD(P)-dependent dehydrogenase (short-subunit alcohol dehydrogenase family)
VLSHHERTVPFLTNGSQLRVWMGLAAANNVDGNMGRVGEAHDIAQAYLFLMQEGFSTGQTAVVDGGTVLV